MKVRLTVVCENSVTAPFGVIGEHGFACFVETEKGNYLFDTGQGFSIVHNCLALKKDLNSIEAIMISHGHYDHTGGLPAVLKIAGHLDVYAHPDIFAEKMSASEGKTRFAGIPYRRSYLESLGACFRLGTEMIEVGSGLTLSGEIPRTSAFEKGDDRLIVREAGGEKVHPDPLMDDQSLIVDSDKCLILVLGCAHAGMINIIDYVMRKMDRDRIHAVIGGTHLGFAGEEQIEETLKVIDRYQIERIGVSHCTGLANASRLHAKLKERFFFGSVGATLEA